MKENFSTKSKQSEFLCRPGIEYFLFEEDFVEENVRCIPMIVRFKMDMAGIKLKLAEWSKFEMEERIELASKKCSNEEEAEEYKSYLGNLIKKNTGKQATVLEIDNKPAWLNLSVVPEVLNNNLRNFGWTVSAGQWKRLTNLQRFALLKLCREGHENKNLPKAMREFKLVS